MEQWRDIPGFEGKYQVSDYGNVRSVQNNILLKPQTRRHIQGKYSHAYGYLWQFAT